METEARRHEEPARVKRRICRHPAEETELALLGVPQTFHPDDEEVRVAIAHFIRELGFEAGEMSFEDKCSIQLGHASLELWVAPKKARRSMKQRAHRRTK
jgi:hypothetical protein